MTWILVLSVVLISFLLRSLDIGLSSYSIDEMVSLSQAVSPHPWAWSWDNVPGLYVWVLKAWVALFGTTEVATRSLSALLSGLATGVLAVTAFRWDAWRPHSTSSSAGWRAAVLVSFIHIFNPLSFDLAREARGYALLELLVSIQLRLFLGFLGCGRRRSWTYLAVSVATVAVHWLGLLSFLLQQGWLATVARSETARFRSLRWVALGGLVLMIGGVTHIKWDFLRWQILKFQVEPLARWPFQVSTDLLAGTGLSVVTAMVFVPFFLRSKSLDPYSQRMSVLKGLSWAILVTVAVATTLGWVTERAILLPRYFMFLVPLVSLLIGLSIHSALEGGAWRRWSALGVLVIWCASVGWIWPSRSEKRSPPWRDLARLVASYPQSSVLTTKTAAIEFPYFKDRKIPVQRWSGDVSQFDRLEKLREGFATVWVLESSWSAAQILPELLPWLRQRRIGYDLMKSTDRGSERIVALKIAGRKPPIPYRDVSAKANP